MINYSKFSNQLKELFVDFSLKLANNLHKPHIKFVTEMIFGIASSNSIHLSGIARTLKETVSTKETIDRLSYNLDKLNSEIVWDNYKNIIKSDIDDDTLFHLDNSDITKPYGSAFEDMCKVKDGSSKDDKTENGFYVTEIVALNNHFSNPVSVYSNIWSSITTGFKSANVKTDEALDSIYKIFGPTGTVIMDRGYDDLKRMNYFFSKKWRFIIRGKKQRNIYYKNKIYKAEEFCAEYKGKYSVDVHLKNKTVNRKCSYFKVNLKGVNKPITMVVVYFNEGPSIFYTNRDITCKKECIKVISDYYKRWRIEEYFKYKKQQFNFEGFRVRSLKRINSLNALLSMTINIINTQCKKTTQLANTIDYCSKAIKEKVTFAYYRVTNGIYFLLSKLTCGVRNLFCIKNKEKQLQLFSVFDFNNFPET